LIAKKVAVIGLDAADWEFLRPWMAAGDLPHLRSLVEGGASGPLRSTNPPFSAPAWATFMTGRLPGGHGLFDFVMEDPLNGRPVLARSDLVQGTRLWEAAAAQGRKSIVVNVPITWPPRPFDGILVSGMLTPKGKPFTHPASLQDEIVRALPRYRCDLDVGLKEEPASLKAHLDDMAFQNLGLMRTLMRRGPWDLFVGVFTTTDRAKHMFWAERETFVRDHYRKVDRAVGELLTEIGPDALVVVLSDHGFHTVRTKFYMNRWLRERGWLDVRETAAESTDLPPEERELHEGLEVFLKPARAKKGFLSRLFGRSDDEAHLEVDLSRTKAYLYSAWTNGVKVNLKGRGPHGTVEPGEEYERLRDSIIAGLREFRFPGSEAPLFDFVGRREEVYSGERLEWAPDVVTRSDGFRVVCGKNLDKGRLLRESTHDSGAHSDTGIVMLRGPGVKPGATLTGAGIEDMAPTVLWALGAELPAGMDGHVLSDAFDPAVVAANPVRTASGSGASGPANADAYSADEEEELRRTLEGLGYI
jgi:predicted AlkP superfamily phosphohydrolase/phosphomutase